MFDQQQKEVDLIEELFDWLFHIKAITVKKVKELIINSIWIKSYENIQELAAFIIQVVDLDFKLHPYLADLLIEFNEDKTNCINLKKLIPFIIEKIMISFASSDKNCSFAYNLLKRGLIKKEEIMEKILEISKIDNLKMYHVKIWFLAELYELTSGKIDYSYNESYIKEFAQSYLPDKIDEYLKMRDKGEPEDPITIALRNDDIDAFQALVSPTIEHISELYIPFNIFEDYNSYQYLNYAASYGSIKCFKYLLLNHFEINKYTFNYAINGGNTEIIKIVEQKLNTNAEFENFLFSNEYNAYDSIIICIAKHKNKLFDWLFENRFLPIATKDSIEYLITMTVFYGNAHALVEILDKKFDFASSPSLSYYLIQLPAQKGFYRMTKLLYNLMQEKLKFIKICGRINSNPNNKEKAPFIIQTKDGYRSIDSLEQYLYYDINYLKSYNYNSDDFNNNDLIKLDDFNFKFSVNWGSSSIFKLFLNLMNKNDSEKVIYYAVENDYISIIEYFFDNNSMFELQIDDQLVSNILIRAVENINNNLFNFVIDKIKQYDPNFFEEFNFDYKILFSACECKNFDAVKRIVDYILDSFYLDNIHNELLTLSFIKGVIAGSYEICKYIIDKKIDFSYDLFIDHSSKLWSIDLEFFILIINSSTQQQKKKLINKFFKPAIFSKNKSLIEYLLKNDAPYENALIYAVLTHDIEIVNMILEHNCKPDFINKVRLNKTALNIAIENEDLEIIERLLSIPGIDLNKSDNDRNTPLKIACDINNINIVKMLLNNENIDVNIFHSCEYSLLMNEINKKHIEIVQLLINHPGIDINIRNDRNETALVLAVYCNLESIVKLLINHKNFDPIKSNLNYAFLASSCEIAKLLISVDGIDINYFHYEYLTYNSTKKFDNNNTYETPLTNAIKSNKNDLIDLIIHHPSFDKDKSQLQTALYYCIINKNILAFKKLLDFVNCNDEISQSLATIFSSDNHLLRYILQYNENNGKFIDFTKLLPNGKSFFTSIIPGFHNIQEIVSLLLKNGADPNIADKYGTYPLQYAIEKNSIKFVQALINTNKIDFNVKIRIKRRAKSENFNTSQRSTILSVKNDRKTYAKYKSYLHLAARANNSEILDELINKKLIDINITDDLGETPLMEACRYSKPTNIEHMFRNDDLNYLLFNKNGEDALKIVAKDIKIEHYDEIRRKNKNEYLQQCLKFARLNSPPK